MKKRKPRVAVWRDYTCERCGETFSAGKRARWCHPCRVARTRESKAGRRNQRRQSERAAALIREGIILKHQSDHCGHGLDIEGCFGVCHATYADYETVSETLERAHVVSLARPKPAWRYALDDAAKRMEGET